ncbi:MAG: multiheme c-type cytochrome [Bryobacteraceae bacterium]
MRLSPVRYGFRSSCALACLLCAAQDIDTVLTADGRNDKEIIDEIEDPAERKAFLLLYGRSRATERLRAAEEFLAQFPQSALLAPAYEIAAKAALDTGEFPKALRMARQSLRLLPENPLLLVPVANVEAATGEYDTARQSALDALEYLDWFARPVSISEKEWPSTLARLQSMCYFVLGRVQIAQAIASAPEGAAFYRQAIDALTRAYRLNPEDGQAAYLLGVAYLSLGEDQPAAAYLKHAALKEAAVKQRALDQIRRIQRKSSSEQAFEAFLSGIGRPAPVPDPESQDPVTQSSVKPERVIYAGSQACRRCHRQEHDSWQFTGMARMLRPWSEESVLGDFTEPTRFGDATGQPLARMRTAGRRHWIELRRESGGWDKYRVDYVIGSKWQQAYATRLPDGQMHVLPVQFNVLRKEWVNYWKVIDPPGSERSETGRFHEMRASTSYQRNCATCHTSQLQTTAGGEARLRHGEFREPGINCEMCHGPAGRHVAAMNSGTSYTSGTRSTSGTSKPPLEAPVKFKELDSRNYVAICAQCHMQSAVREMGGHGEINYTGSAGFFRSYRSRPYNEFSRKAFYRDGRFRETTFIVEAFRRSECFRKGQAHCGHCHNPHPPDPRANPASLKFLQEPDEMCLQCHQQYRGKLESHTRHPVSSEGSRCVSCHMPKIMNSLLFQARSHEIDDSPDAGMTLRFGSSESPNACLLCHQDKDARWAQTELQSW